MGRMTAAQRAEFVNKTYRKEGTEREHRVRAERALGRPLPPGAEVHHADGTKSAASALVICQDRAYHMLLHAKMRVLQAGGDPNTMVWCSCCGPRLRALFGTRLTGRGSGRATSYCRDCQRARDAKRRPGGSKN